MGVHLLGQLARDLDRLHLRGEGTAEDPFDEVLDPLLKVAQDAHGFGSLARARPGLPSRAWARILERLES